MHISIKRNLQLFLMLFVVIGFTGCGNEGLESVRGTVTIAGQPAPAGLYVSFDPIAPDGSSSFGYTDDKGTYYLRFNVHRDGATQGMNRVSVSVPTGAMQEDGTMSVNSELSKISIPPEFNAKTKLEFDVQPGSNTFDIELPAECLKQSTKRR